MNRVQRSLGFTGDSESNIPAGPTRPPVSDRELREKFLDRVGHLVRPQELRLAVYQGGVEPGLRKVVWRHLLNVVPDGMSGSERFDYMKRKKQEYFKLRDMWKKQFVEAKMTDEVKYITNLVRKDVLRTDRTQSFYAGSDDNKNTTALFNVLTTYAYTHPEVSYCQGMSDIASPLLVTMKDEAYAYICFCGLMKRLRPNFLLDGEAMTLKFQHLSDLLQHCDPVFFEYLRMHGADDLLFCYRWLLLELKREFAFEDALYMLEVVWSTLPPDPPESEISLHDENFEELHASFSTSPVNNKENPYTRLRAIRRQTSVSNSPVVKEAPLTVLSPDSCCLNKVPSVDMPSPDLDSEEMLNLEYRSLTTAMTRQLRSELSSLNHSIVTDQRLEMESPSPGLCDDAFFTRTDSVTSAVENYTNGEDNQRDSVSPDESKNSIRTEIIVHHRKDSDISMTDSVSAAKLTFSTLKVQIEEERLNENVSCEHLADRTGQVSPSVDLTAQDSVETEGNDNDIAPPPDSYEYLSGVNGRSYDSDRSARGSSDYEDKRISRESDIAVLPLPVSILLSNAGTMKTHDISKEVELVTGKVGSITSFESSSGESSSIAVISIPECLSLSQDNGPFGTAKEELPQAERGSHLEEAESKKEQTIAPSNLLRPSSLGNLKRFFSDRLQEMVSPSRQDQPDLNESDTPLSAVSNYSARTEMGMSANSYEAFHATEHRSLSLVGDHDTNSDIEFLQVPKENLKPLPPPHEFGHGNPFLMFLCLTLLLQHRDYIMKNRMDYDEIAMTFNKMVRSHDVHRVLHQGRAMYAEYLKRWQSSNTSENTGDGVDLSV